MASELRVNYIKNRSGLGTVTFADNGLVISGITSLDLGSTNLVVGGNARVSGIVTATSFSGSGANLTNVFNELDAALFS